MIEGLSIVLPTFNERQNLEILVPEILNSAWGFSAQNLRLIVVDDNSTDGTLSVLQNYVNLDSRFSYIVRSGKPSLPLSIWEGIYASETGYVAWLDADGSMPIRDLIRFVSIVNTEDLDVVVGSRFVAGGGFKGLNEVGKTTVRDFYSNLKDSQDSILAVVLSRALNEILRMILRAGIRDLTSGFIVADKNFINESDFVASYGDYCPVLIKRFVLRGARIQEIGYLCVPRVHGQSKTGSSIITYIRRGLPYISRSLHQVFRKP
jgi:glycosyltransferase involved in cell wall biosynthesis